MNPVPSRERMRQTREITWIGVFINLGLAAVKFAAGILGSSQAVIADAVHSLSDLGTDFAVILGVRYWSAPPDEDHPYGHLRIEALITVLIGLALAGVALGLGYKALTTIRMPHPRPTSWIALIGPAVSIVLKEGLYRRTIRVGKQVRSQALVANAWHHRSDALSSLPALIAVSVAAVHPAWSFFDHAGAVLISLFILKVAWDIVRPSISELTDGGASKEDRERIRGHALGVPGVKAAHKIRTRQFGGNLSVDLHILVDPEMSVRKGHAISEEVKRVLIRNGPDILDVVVHLEPFE